MKVTTKIAFCQLNTRQVTLAGQIAKHVVRGDFFHIFLKMFCIEALQFYLKVSLYYKIPN